MATQYAVHQVTLQDDKGERRSIPLYFTYDSATTLSAILAYASVTLEKLDAITDGQIVSHSITLNLAIPGGLKASPVADCDVEETGLITYLTSAPVKRSFGQDIPSFKQSKFVGGKINLADTDVTAWTDRFIATGTSLVGSNQDFLAALASVRTGRKTFRKSRRAAERT